jgi:putative transposase
MARFARVIVPGYAYHVTYRGNRGEDVFFTVEDRLVYREWLGQYAHRYGMEILAYCLMTNHVHLLVKGHRRDSLSKAIGRTNGRYARWVNDRHGWRGHLWANRYFSTPLDEAHSWRTVKYVELNPVRAGIVGSAEAYRWSSAVAHASGVWDPLLSPNRPFPGPISDWSGWLEEGLDEATLNRIRRNTRTGRPTGSESFIDQMGSLLGRSLKPSKPGPKAGSLGARRAEAAEKTNLSPKLGQESTRGHDDAGTS